MVDFELLRERTAAERRKTQAEREAEYQAAETARLAVKAQPVNAAFPVEGEVVEVSGIGPDREMDYCTAVYIKPDRPLRAMDGHPYLRVIVVDAAFPQITAAIQSGTITPRVRVRVRGDLRRSYGTTQMHAQAIELA